MIYDELQEFWKNNKDFLYQFRSRISGVRSSQVNALLGFIERPIDIKLEMLNLACEPKKGSEDAAGYDVKVREISYHPKYVKVTLGFKSVIPKGYEAWVISRSSISNKGWQLVNGIGLIDSDYRGEWEMRFVPTTVNYTKFSGNIEDHLKNMHYPFPYEELDRCGQFVIKKSVNTKLTKTVVYNDTKRGSGGFGSTGKK